MVICVCSKCKYVDLLEAADQRKCGRCGSDFIDLGMGSSEWNKLSNDEMKSIINAKILEYNNVNSSEEVEEIKQPIFEDVSYTQEESVPVSESSEGVISDDTLLTDSKPQIHNYYGDGAERTIPNRKKVSIGNFEENPQNTYSSTKIESSTKEGFSVMSIVALILSILGVTSIIGLVLGIIDLTKKDNKKKGLSIATIVISCIFLVIFTSIVKNNSDTKETEDVEQEVTEEKDEDIQAYSDVNDLTGAVRFVLSGTGIKKRIGETLTVYIESESGYVVTLETTVSDTGLARTDEITDENGMGLDGKYIVALYDSKGEWLGNSEFTFSLTTPTPTPTPEPTATPSPVADETEEVEEEPSEEIVTSPATEIYVCDLIEKWKEYKGENVSVAFEVNYAMSEGRINSEYYDTRDGSSNIEVRLQTEEEPNVNEGDYVIIEGMVSPDSRYDCEIENAVIIKKGAAAKTRFEEEKAIYDEQISIEKQKFIDNLVASAEVASYDSLMRYPDSYKGKPIVMKVTILRAETDGLIFDGEIEGEYEGKSVDVSDKRDLKEPKLQKGDKVTLYGYADGLTTVNTYDKSGIIPKKVDSHYIPRIEVKYLEMR